MFEGPLYQLQDVFWNDRRFKKGSRVLAPRKDGSGTYTAGTVTKIEGDINSIISSLIVKLDDGKAKSYAPGNLEFLSPEEGLKSRMDKALEEYTPEGARGKILTTLYKELAQLEGRKDSSRYDNLLEVKRLLLEG